VLDIILAGRFTGSERDVRLGSAVAIGRRAGIEHDDASS
jgi:hypothetical protein